MPPLPLRDYILLFSLALGLRIGAVAALQGLDAPPKGDANPDQLDYETFAYHLSAGDGFCLIPGEPSACRPPGTAFALAPIYWMFGHSYAAGRVWFCLLSAATCVATAWACRPAVGHRAAFVAGYWLAVYPGHLYYSMHFLGEVPFSLGVALACGFTLRAQDRAVGRAIAYAALAWGWTILVRPNMALGAVAVAVMFGSSGGLTRRQRVVKVVAFGCLAAVVVVPWVVRNAIVMGKPTIATVVGGFTFWGSYNSVVATDPHLAGYWIECNRLADADHPLVGNEVERDRSAWSYGWEFVRESWQEIPALSVHKIGRVLLAYPEAENRTADLAFRLGWAGSAPLVLIGMVLARRRAPGMARVFLVPLGATLVTAILFYGCSRFRDGVAPALAPFVGLAVVAIWQKVRARFSQSPEGRREISPAPDPS